MSLVPHGNDPTSLIEEGFDLANQLLYHAYHIYYWLNDIAPVLIKYRLRQLGRDFIESLPLLTKQTKEEIKRWLKETSFL